MKYLPLLILVFMIACDSSQRASSNDEIAKSESPETEKLFLELGGESQYVEIISTSAEKPILLFVHGGPAWPQTPQLRYYSTELSQTYTMIIWEQRGAGQSYMKNPSPPNISVDQIVEDGHELTQWIKDKYKDLDIYLTGYSFGSHIGLEMANQYPQDYKAYVAISQIVNSAMAYDISVNWLKEKAAESGDKTKIASVDSLDHPEFFETASDRFLRKYFLLNDFGGAVYNMAAEEETQEAMAMYDDYKDYDWYGVWGLSSEAMKNDRKPFDAMQVKSLDLPVVLLQGRHDWNVPSVLAEKWLDQLNAPFKKIYWFEESGHGPLEEEPEKFNKVMMEIPELIAGNR